MTDVQSKAICSAHSRYSTWLGRLRWTLAIWLVAVTPVQAQTEPVAEVGAASPGTPIRLRPAAAMPSTNVLPAQIPAEQVTPYEPDDFERYVRSISGTPQDVRRLGSELISVPQALAGTDPTALVPADYLIAAGDEIQVTLWGSVDADVRVTVDRSGRISLPRVGSFMVAGTRYADLPDVITRRVSQVFKNFQLSVGLGQLRSVRVYVTGFAKRPGALHVTSLSTIVNVLIRSGGPSTAGSFRKIELRRGSKAIASFDLYDFLLKGDKSGDRIVQAEDVIHIGPVGAQVGLIGSFNRPAVLELIPGETMQDALVLAGGFTAVADRSRVTIESLSDRDGKRIAQLRWPDEARRELKSGDIVRAFSQVDSRLSTQLQNKRVRVEGEVERPGEYILPPDSTLADALRAAGGLSPQAYVFGAEFSRESVRARQQENYDRALRDLEIEFSKAAYTRRALTADEVAAQAAAGSGSTMLIQRLREVRPTGRIVLQFSGGTPELPALALEDGDRLYVPARPDSVGVFGSVFNGGNYLFNQGRSVDDFLRLAGGPTRGADTDSVFVLRANGSVISTRQDKSWFGSGNLTGVQAQPGDTIFVPEEVGRTTIVQSVREWTQILAQFGLGAAAIKVLR